MCHNWSKKLGQKLKKLYFGHFLLIKFSAEKFHQLCICKIGRSRKSSYRQLGVYILGFSLELSKSFLVNHLLFLVSKTEEFFHKNSLKSSFVACIFFQVDLLFGRRHLPAVPAIPTATLND